MVSNEDRLKFIETAALPRPASATEFVEPAARPSFTGGVQENLVLGSQLAIVREEVSGELRRLVSNTILFAQLTTRAQAEKDGYDSREWFETYYTALEHLGWERRKLSEAKHVTDQKITQVHEVVSDLLKTVIGAGANAAMTTITAVLDGLVRMEEELPWITFYSNKSETVAAKQFQIGNVTGDDESATFSMVRLTLTSTLSVRQFLFFKDTETVTNLEHQSMTLTGNLHTFRHAAETLEDRLQPFLASYATTAPLPTNR